MHTLQLYIKGQNICYLSHIYKVMSYELQLPIKSHSSYAPTK